MTDTDLQTTRRPPSGKPAVPAHTGSATTRVLGVISVLGLVAVGIFGLVVSPPDTELGETIRILYMHVPTVSVAYLAFVITAVASVAYLWKRTEFWDLLAASSAEIGVVFFALTIFNGMMWGKVTWGVFWRWEPRLVTTTVLFITYIGYLVVRSIPAQPRTRGTVSAVIGIMAVVNIPITHKAVDWWRGLHQSRSVLGTVDPEMQGTQLFTTYLSLTVFMVLFAWLLMHRFRLAWLSERAADAGLEGAIEQRRAEAPADLPATDSAGGDDSGPPSGGPSTGGPRP